MPASPLSCSLTLTVVWYPTADICLASSIGVPSDLTICTGNIFDIVVLSPNWPYPLYPTPHTVPSSIKITVCAFPADTSFTPCKIPVLSLFIICWGTEYPVLLFKPNWPLLFAPTPHTLPSASNIIK